MKGRKDAFRVLVGTHEGKRPLGRPGHRWEDNIKVAPFKAELSCCAS
jgi:hypothetical protein